MNTLLEKFVARENIINDEAKLHTVFDVPSVCYQGDLIFVALHRLPASAKTRTNRQLADGDTQGSRHVLERGALYDCNQEEVVDLIKEATGVKVRQEYIGPVLVAPDNPTANDLTHPEHGNQGWPAGTICAVVIQRNLGLDGQENRVAD